MSIAPDQPHHVEIHLDARGRGAHRVVLNGEDLAAGLSSLTLTANSRDRFPVLTLEPLVVTGDVDAEVIPVLHLPDEARAALVALGWTPPADPDADPGLPLSALFDNEPTPKAGPEDCTTCGQAINMANEHIVIVRQLERVDPDRVITVASSRPVAQYHEQCAPATSR